MMENEYHNLPKDYDFLINDLRTSSEKIYFQNLQFSQGKGSNFKSLDLIFFNDKNYQFLNSGFEIIPVGNDKISNAKVTIVKTTSEETWKGENVIDFNKYNPKNVKENFSLLKYFTGVSEENVLANLINNLDGNQYKKDKAYRKKNYTYYAVDKEKKKKKYKANLNIFINDINKANNIKIDIKKAQNESLESLCQQIATQKKSDCSNAVYNAYIDDKDEEFARIKMDNFFSNISNKSLSEITDELILPRGEIQFEEKKLNLFFPKELFFPSENSNEISLNIYRIEHHLTYDYDNNTYVLKVKIFPYTNSVSSDFKFESSYYDALKGENVTSEIFVDKNSFESIDFLIYPNKMKASVFFSKDGYGMNYLLKKEIVFRK